MSTGSFGERRYSVSSINILKKDITEIKADAIVNAANSALKMGGGVCGAIFSAAGPHRLQKACDKIGHCPTGSAVITPAFDLPAEYIIHAVGPRWTDGEHNESELLQKAYTRSLELAAEYGCRSVCFPLISAGIYGFPVDKAWAGAIHACCVYLWEHEGIDLEVIFAVRDNSILEIGEKNLKRSAPDLCAIPAKKGDWKTVEMPEQQASLIFRREFSESQMKRLRRGWIPMETGDRWFCYMEGNTLYIHRAATGFCVYILELSEDGNHRVTVNCDLSQINWRKAAYNHLAYQATFGVAADPSQFNWKNPSQFDWKNEDLEDLYLGDLRGMLDFN